MALDELHCAATFVGRSMMAVMAALSRASRPGLNCLVFMLI